MKRAVDATRLKFHHHTWGPTDLFYGDLYSSREVPCRSTSIPGNRDGYSACVAAELERDDLYDFLLLSLPDNDQYSHRHGPEATVESIAKADHCFGKLLEAAGGLEKFLETHALILLADHAQTAVDRELPLSRLLARDWEVLQPSEDRTEEAQLAVSPSGRAAHVYLLPEAREPADPLAVGALLAETEGVELVCWLEDEAGTPLKRSEPGTPAGGGEIAVVERQGRRLRFHPLQRKKGLFAHERVSPLRDLRGRRWVVEGELGVLEASVDGGKLHSDEFPDPLGRVWSALTAPQAGDFIVSLSPGFEAVDWGGVTHVPGGSHGSLRRGDSLGPLLFVGCGPADAAERQQWALRDVAAVVLDHFGLTGEAG